MEESIVWKFCTKLGKSPAGSTTGTGASCQNPSKACHLVKCNICQKEYKQTRGSTSSLLKHLKCHHSKQFYEAVPPEQKPTSNSSKESLSLSRCVVSYKTVSKLSQYSAPGDLDTDSSRPRPMEVTNDDETNEDNGQGIK